MTYTRDIIVVALSFGKKTIPDLPCKDWWTLAFIVGNAFHYARGGHSWLGSTNGTRLDRARLIVPAKKKKRWKKSWKSHVSQRPTFDCIDWLTFHFCLTAASKIWDCLVTFLRLVTFHVVLAKLGYYWVMTSKPVEVGVPITELHYVGWAKIKTNSHRRRLHRQQTQTDVITH